MSEYQYYEFAAIERPLTHDEMAELRAVSSRAEIRSSGFVNHYEWGDLKADPFDWMQRYFDAFVYSANWCSCRLALRLPLVAFDTAELEPFRAGRPLTIEATGTHWIIDWCLDESEDDERFAMDDGSGWMRRLAPLRDELLRGDLRPLYLGWLAAASVGELDDAALEPAVPPGLSLLSPAQQALVEFLAIDSDMLAAASAGSARTTQDDATQARLLDAWIGEWTHDDMAAVVKLIVQGRASEAERRVHARHAAWLKALRPPSATAEVPRRSVGRLCELAQAAASVRRAREAEEHARQEAEQRSRHEAYLRLWVVDADRHWATVDAQAQRGTASGYERAVRTLKDLAEAYELTARRKEFDRALRRLLVRHATRGALLRRLTDAGLWSG